MEEYFQTLFTLIMVQLAQTILRIGAAAVTQVKMITLFLFPSPLVTLSQPATTTTSAKAQRLLHAVGHTFIGHLENSWKTRAQGQEDNATAWCKHYLSHHGIQQ